MAGLICWLIRRCSPVKNKLGFSLVEGLLRARDEEHGQSEQQTYTARVHCLWFPLLPGKPQHLRYRCELGIGIEEGLFGSGCLVPSGSSVRAFIRWETASVRKISATTTSSYFTGLIVCHND